MSIAQIIDPRSRSAVPIAGIVIVGGLVILAMWAMALTSIGNSREAAMDHARAEAHNLAAAFADEVSHVLGGVDDATEIIARRLRAGHDPRELSNWTKQIPLLSLATIQVGIISPDGRLVSTTLDPNPPLIDLSDREHIRVHLDGVHEGIFVSKPVVGRLSDKVSLNITKGVRGESGQLIGIVLFSLSPGQLTGLGEAFELGQEGSIALIGFDNVVRARFTREAPDGLAGIGTTLPGQRITPALINGAKEGAFTGKSPIDSVERIVNFRRIANYPLAVIATLGMREALAASNTGAWMILGIALAATLLLIVFVGYLIREIRRRAVHAAELATERRKLEADIARREQVEEELRETQETLQDAVDSLSEGFAIYDRDDRLVLSNETMRRMYPQHTEVMKPGLRFEEIMRTIAVSGSAGDAVGREEEWVSERVRAHRSPSGSFEQRLSDGRHLMITDRRMRNGGIASLRVDITQLKQSEARLREAMENLDRVQLIAGVGSLEEDMTGETRSISWTPSACALFGIDPAAVEPSPEFLINLIHPDDRDKVIQAAKQANSTATPAPPLEYRIIRPDGSERVVYRENAIHTDVGGKLIRRIITYKDITDIKRATSRLHETMEMLERAQRLAHMGSDVRDFETDYAEWSEESYRIFGVEPDKFFPSTENFLARVLPEDRKLVLATRQQIAQGICPDPFEYRIRRPDGEVRHIYRETELIRDPSGKAKRMIGTIHDVTEARAIDARLHQAKDNLERAQRIAHLGMIVRDAAAHSSVSFQEKFSLGDR